MMRRRLAYAALLLSISLVYAGSLNDPFQFDDMHAVRDNHNLRSVEHVPRYFVDPGAFSADSSLTMYRPLLLTTFAINHAISASNTWSYHVINVVVHAAVAVALFELLLLLGLPGASALLGAALFGLNPAHSEAVYYISSRSESLAALCVVVALVLHMRASRAPRHVMGLSIGATLVFACGLLTKSIAIVFLPLALLTDLLVSEHIRPAGLIRGTTRWRQRLPWYGSYCAVSMAYLLFTRDLITRATLSAPVRSMAEQFWSQVKGVVYYVHLLMAPRGLSIDHQFQLSSGPDVYATCAALFLLSIAVLVVLGYSRSRLGALLVLWFVVALAPASAVPLNVIVNEHRIYLSGVAFAAGIVCLPPRSGRQVLAMRGLWLLLPVFAVLSMLRGNAWDSELSIWEDAMHKAPDMARPRFILGQQALRSGDTARATTMLSTGLQLDPGFVPAYRMLAEARVTTGDLAGAARMAEQGTRQAPESADVWALLAEVSREQALAGDGTAARTWFERSAAAYVQALALTPDVAAYQSNLGNTLEVLGKPEEALGHHLKAVGLNPHSAASRLNLGNVLRSLGRFPQAERVYRKAVEMAPLYVDAWINLAALYEQMGASAQAAAARANADAARGRP